MPDNSYPATAQECLHPNAKFRPAVLRAVRTFRRAKPWRGTQQERIIKFAHLHQQLCQIYRLPVELRFSIGAAESDSGHSHYSPAARQIVLSGRLSVITYLHEFAHARFGRSERKAVTWSLNLFRRTFPRSFARLQFEGHVARRAGERLPGLQLVTEPATPQPAIAAQRARSRRSRRRRRAE